MMTLCSSSSDDDASPDGKPPFGIISAVIGVQGRLFGMPVKPKQNYEDMLEEDTEPDEEPGHEARPEPESATAATGSDSTSTVASPSSPSSERTG